MKNLETIIRVKNADYLLQVLAGCIAVGLCPFTFCMSFFILGIVHALSTLFWMIAEPEAGFLPSRRIIQWVNVTVLILWISTLFLRNNTVDFTGNFTFAMVFAGPILGISYFIITGREIRYYKSLASTSKQFHFSFQNPEENQLSNEQP